MKKVKFLPMCILVWFAAGFVFPAHADMRFRWVDSDGYYRTTKDAPDHGIPVERITVPDDIRWRRPVEKPAAVDPDAEPQSSEKLFKQLSPSVVYVVWMYKDQPIRAGSGVAISEEDVMTNCHIFGADPNGSPVLIDGSQRLDGDIVARDVDGDRCVVHFRRAQLTPITAVRDANDLEEGEMVYAIGNPRGLKRSISSGLLAGRRKSDSGEPWLQFTAPISAGSSGGGLFDARGNLIGITEATILGAQNMNIAIPASSYWK